MISFYPDRIIVKDDFIDNLNRLNIKNIPLRYYDNKELLNLDNNQHQKLSKLLSSNKIKVLYLDFNIIYSDESTIEINNLFELAKLYDTRKIIIPLPTFINFEDEKEVLLETINNLLRESRKNKIDFVFHVNYLIDSAIIAYLIKNIKNISFHFNPGLCFINKKSITSYYRILKKNINVVSLFDMEDFKKPALLGYGKALIIDNIDKLLKDKFRGPIIYDFNLDEYTDSLKTGHKVPFYKKWFGGKKRKAHLEMDQKLNLTEDMNLDTVKIIETQLNFIKKYQNL